MQKSTSFFRRSSAQRPLAGTVRLRSALGFCGSLLYIPGCQPDVARPLLDLFEGKATYYGYSFGGVPPEGLGLRVVILDRDATCASLPTLERVDSVQIRLSGHQGGEYRIDPQGLARYGQGEFVAFASHSIALGEGTDAFKYVFPRGTMTAELPSEVWANGEIPAEMHGLLDAYAPLDPYGVGECSGSSDGKTICQCIKRDGETTECEPVHDGEDCCMFQVDEFWKMQTEVAAQFCPFLCDATSPSLFSEFCDAM